MLNIPRMKLALPKWIWPDVQRLITSASSVVFKRALASNTARVCASLHTNLPVFHIWLNIYNTERQPVKHTHTDTQTWGRERESKIEIDRQKKEEAYYLMSYLAESCQKVEAWLARD